MNGAIDENDHQKRCRLGIHLANIDNRCASFSVRVLSFRDLKGFEGYANIANSCMHKSYFRSFIVRCPLNLSFF